MLVGIPDFSSTLRAVNLCCRYKPLGGVGDFLLVPEVISFHPSLHTEVTCTSSVGYGYCQLLSYSWGLRVFKLLDHREDPINPPFIFSDVMQPAHFFQELLLLDGTAPPIQHICRTEEHHSWQNEALGTFCKLGVEDYICHLKLCLPQSPL